MPEMAGSMTVGSVTAPHVVLGCFSRGGSSLVWNLLASHPDLVSPGVETHELFVGRRADRSAWAKWRVHLRHAMRGGGLPRPRLGGRHVLANAGLFEPSNLSRRAIPTRMASEVRDVVLAAPAGVTPSIDPVLAESGPGRGDIASEGGVVLKSINGIVFLTPSLRACLGEVRSVLLVRDGLAMCESRLRRGTFSDVSKFAVVYRLIVEEMRRQLAEVPSTSVVFFEDLLADPVTFTRHLYRLVGLDPDAVHHVRLKEKPLLGGSGEATSEVTRPRHRWVDIDELPSVIAPAIDEIQSSRLGHDDRVTFERTAAEALEWIGALRRSSPRP